MSVFLLIGYCEAVLPAFHNCADDLQIVAENRPFGVEAVLNQKPNEPIGQNFISCATLNGERDKGNRQTRLKSMQHTYIIFIRRKRMRMRKHTFLCKKSTYTHTDRLEVNTQFIKIPSHTYFWCGQTGP